MSSDNDTPEDDTPEVRVRTRTRTADTPVEGRESVRVRQRRNRKLTTDDTPTPPAPRDVMDPGPTVNWPAMPRNPTTGEIEPEAVQSRVRSLYAVSREAGTEFILETLHMLLLQHRPMDDIARIFGVTVRTIVNWRIKLRERIGEDFRTRVPTDLAAEQVANIKRTKAYAWQQAARCTDPLDKIRWVNLTLKCEQELANLYKEVKVYKAIDPRREVTENSDDGAASLAKIAEEFLTGGYAGAKDAKKGKKKGGEETQDPDADLLPEYDENDPHLMF